MNKTIGNKYYKYVGDKLELLRLVRIKNEDSYVMRDALGITVKLTKDELLGYTKLNSDGYITFAIVSLEQGIQDVIVSIHRREDILKGDNIPYCVCRQNIYDMFTHQLERSEAISHIGMSISKDTCPMDVKFEMVLACNSIVSLSVVNVYLDDSLEDILKFISPLNYDAALRVLADKMDGATVKGNCRALKALLEEKEFFNDFHRGFGIHKLPYAIRSKNLTEEMVLFLEAILKHRVLEYSIVKYGMDIDMKAVATKHLLIVDNLDNLYLVLYTEGEYVNREYEALNDKSDREIMVNKL